MSLDFWTTKRRKLSTNEEWDRNLTGSDSECSLNFEGPKNSPLTVSKSVEQWKEEGCKCVEEGNYLGALRSWSSALEVDPNNASIYEMKGQVLIEMGSNLEAIKACQKATEISPSWADGWWTLARAQREMGEVYLSISNYSKALELDKENPEIQQELLEMQQTASKLSKVKEKYQHMITTESSPSEEEVARCFINLSNRVMILGSTNK